jgi:hypothetical protein
VGGGGGDPHIQRWGREHSSFHGECDLVMIHSDNFHKGAGFDLHARTTIADYFSYIETAALRVGEHTVQFYKDHVVFNGEVHKVEELPLTFGGEFKYTISNAPVEASKNERFYQYYKVDLHKESILLFKFYKNFLTINVSGHPDDFSDAVGLLGDYTTGDMITRDGDTMTDFDQFGFEWQVNPQTDGQLFLDDRSPQLPFEQCRMPTAARPARRNLRQNKELFAQASKACGSAADLNLCVDDVMTTGDVGLANLW